MSNILIDFHYTEPTREGFEKFFSTHAPWIFDDIQRYRERTGADWWKSKDAAGFWVDHERVRQIVDDYFAEKILKTSLLEWLQSLEKKLMWHLTTEPSVDYREDEIDLAKHRLVRTSYDPIHQIALEPLYTQLYEELLKILRAEKRSIKRCPTCEKLFVPKQAGGHPQKYCSHACRQRAYRKRKGQC